MNTQHTQEEGGLRMEVGQREIKLRGGRIILHTRADDRHGVWQCRLRLGTERKLVRRSTKTTDLAEAKATAEELYEESRLGHLARNRRGRLEK